MGRCRKPVKEQIVTIDPAIDKLKGTLDLLHNRGQAYHKRVDCGRRAIAAVLFGSLLGTLECTRYMLL